MVQKQAQVVQGRAIYATAQGKCQKRTKKVND